MGDHNRRSAAHHLAERLLDLGFRPHVERRGGVVEDEHPRVREERAGKAEPLPLTARQREALFADDRVDSVREGLDEVEGLGLAKRQADLVVGCVRSSERDVGPHTCREKEGVVVHDADASTERVQRHVLHVDAVNRDAPGPGIDEAGQQQGDSRLPRPAGTDNAN